MKIEHRTIKINEIRYVTIVAEQRGVFASPLIRLKNRGKRDDLSRKYFFPALKSLKRSSVASGNSMSLIVSSSWLVNFRGSLMRLLSPLTPSTDICLAPPFGRALVQERAGGQSAGANSVLVAGPRKERESPLVRTFVRLSRHLSVNEPRVAGEPSWSTRAARDPHYHNLPRPAI